MIHGSCKTEVCHRDDSLPVDQQIARLDVAMQRALRVGVVEGLRGLDANLGHRTPMIRVQSAMDARRSRAAVCVISAFSGCAVRPQQRPS